MNNLIFFKSENALSSYINFTEQWEKDLEAELKEYEVVAGKNNDDKQWEKECEDLLGEEEDLK